MGERGGPFWYRTQSAGGGWYVVVEAVSGEKAHPIAEFGGWSIPAEDEYAAKLMCDALDYVAENARARHVAQGPCQSCANEVQADDGTESDDENA